MTSKERHEARYQRRVAKRKQKQHDVIRNVDTFEKLLDFSNFEKSFKKCKRGVSWKHSVQNYAIHLYEYIYKTLEKIEKAETVCKGFVEFDINERGKQRHIKSVHISERVVQKLCCMFYLTPLIDRSLIYDNFASTKGKGTHKCLRRLRCQLQKYYRKYGNKGYILLIDIKGFFDHIKHIEVFKKLKSLCNDNRIVELIMQFVDAFNPLFSKRTSKKKLTKIRKFKKRLSGVSMGLGSEVSQTFAKSYTNEIDHFMKEVLHLPFGHYMDDYWIISSSKKHLQKVLEIFKTMASKIGLALNENKTRIYRLKDTWTFLKVKFNLLNSGKVLRRVGRKSVTRMRRKLKKLQVKLNNHEIEFETVLMSYESWKGHIKDKSSRKTKHRMDKLYNKLFIEDWHPQYDIAQAEADYRKLKTNEFAIA